MVRFAPPCVRKTYVGNHGERKLPKELRIIHIVHFFYQYMVQHTHSAIYYL